MMMSDILEAWLGVTSLVVKSPCLCSVHLMRVPSPAINAVRVNCKPGLRRFGVARARREGPCGPVSRRCSGTAVPPEPYSRRVSLPSQKEVWRRGDADLSERGREARLPFHLVVWLEPGEDRRV
ncbi:UNVERIFIED_CONTAM: hypothetical protein FKN15_052850 [Acipenser sinensis]